MALAIEQQVQTQDLLRLFKFASAAGMRGILFEAYAASTLAAGGSFPVKSLDKKATEDTLQLANTPILQKNTKELNMVKHPLKVIEGKLVWPKIPDFHLPAIDMFTLHGTTTLIAFQMTVAKSHNLDSGGCKAFLTYFDAVCRASKCRPNRHSIQIVLCRPNREWRGLVFKDQPAHQSKRSCSRQE
jgi:hypothetical protein